MINRIRLGKWKRFSFWIAIFFIFQIARYFMQGISIPWFVWFTGSVLILFFVIDVFMGKENQVDPDES